MHFSSSHNNIDARSARSDEIEQLARLPLFCGLSEQCMAHVTAEAAVVRYRQGAPVIRQGELPQYLHVLIDGQVGLLGAASDGEETMVEILGNGESFIAAAVLTARPYLMSAVTLRDSRILQLPADRLRGELRTNPDLALAMLTSLSTHYRMLVREVKDLKLKSAAQRLAVYLMGLAARREGGAIVRLPHSKGMMAARIGIRAETLSRAFASLRAEGVAVSGNTVTITDLAALSAFCDDGDEII